MEQLNSIACFGGMQNRYQHSAKTLNCEMNFSVFLPPGAEKAQELPVVYWLSGLTCTDENFVQKAGAQRVAAELGLVIVAPDTSPRGEAVADDPDGAWDFGLGAGFYVDATEAPWAEHYQMYSYITDELPQLVQAHFPVSSSKQAIMGHSMGGHGALTIALKNSANYKSVSAFAPICAPMQCPWGQKALGNYLGSDQSNWQDYDASFLISQCQNPLPTLIDQGAADSFLSEQLKPELLLAAARQQAYPLDYRFRAGYDHSYFYIASFIEEHLRFHAQHLN